MNRHAKTISNSVKPKIRTLKSQIASTKNPFDGCGYIFKQALKELREEGFVIKYQKEKCRYIKEKTPESCYPVTDSHWLGA